jgi:hypothetical protein
MEQKRQLRMTIEKIRALFTNRKFDARPNAVRYIFLETNLRITSVPEYAGTYHIYKDEDSFYLRVKPKILNEDFLITLRNNEIILTGKSSITGIPFVVLTPAPTSPAN